MHVIGIMGAQGSGKSQIATHLVEKHGYTRMSMADPLKAGLRAMGVPLELESNRALREVPQGLLCGKSWRYVARTIGTEWGREMIGEDLWVNLLRERITRLGPDAKVVIDDIRFPNEIAMTAELGGSLWRVTRPGVGEQPPLWRRVLAALSFGAYQPEHPSEVNWRRANPAVDIENDTSVEALHAVVDWAIT